MDIQTIVYSLAAMVVVLTIHEFSHAAVADYLGDPTARLRGRMSLNPLVHLDAVGSLVFIVSMLGGIGFGWAKPVPVDPFNLRDPKRDSMLISLAGPASNLLTAIVLSGILRLPFFYAIPLFNQILAPFFYVLVLFSVVIAIFNLIPIHPLDGGKILVGLLPNGKAQEVDLFLRRYGIFILIFLLFTRGFTAIISPILQFVLNLLLPGSGGLFAF